MSLDAAWALDWARRAAELIAENRAELTELDRAIGDADHGDNLDRGMKAVVSKLNAAQQAGGIPANPGGVLKLVATTLMATVGGAGGPLLGTAFLKASRSSEAASWGPEELARALEEATSGLEVRGHANSGDKTMADAWRPAAVAAKEAAEVGEDEVASSPQPLKPLSRAPRTPSPSRPVAVGPPSWGSAPAATETPEPSPLRSFFRPLSKPPVTAPPTGSRWSSRPDLGSAVAGGARTRYGPLGPSPANPARSPDGQHVPDRSHPRSHQARRRRAPPHRRDSASYRGQGVRPDGLKVLAPTEEILTRALRRTRG